MNYFDLFDLPVSFNLDKTLLKQRYFQKSREFHPDFFTQASEEDKQQALEQSSIINSAYKILQDEQARMKYILLIEDVIKENDKDLLPQAFLFEMMEINEELEELLTTTSKDNIQSFTAKLDKQQLELKSEIQQLFDKYPPLTSEELSLIRDYYFKTKYLNRIMDKLDKIIY